VRCWRAWPRGWGIRAIARILRPIQDGPNTGLGEAAEQLKAFSSYFLCAVQRPTSPTR